MMEAEHTHLLEDSDASENDITQAESESGAVKGYNYEEAIVRTGYGRFHYTLLLLCGWALSSDAIEVLSISFILPPATCDLQLSNSDKGWLTSIIFLGMMVGSFLWGTLADIHGRRAVLLWSLMVNGMGGLASSFSQNYPMFLFLRFVSGIGVGGSLPVVFAYYTEFQPKHKRGAMISMLATFWMSGNIVAAGLAWLVIPHTQMGTSTPEFTYNSWRIYLALCTIPSISSSLCFACMPESPKFLLQSGQASKASLVFRKMYIKNNPNRPLTESEEASLRSVRSEDSRSSSHSRDRSIQTGLCTGWWYKFKHAATVFCQSTKQLFQPPLTTVTIILTIIFFTLSFGYYGMFLWFPELFNRIEKYGGTPCSTHEGNSTIPNNSSDPCASDSVDMTIYFESFLAAISNLPGNILTILIIDRVNRNYLLAGSMVLSGISVFFIALLKNRTQSIIMSCLFSGISVIGWNALDVIGMELFPTSLRSTANGVEMSVGRIAAILGNVAFGQLVDVHCIVPMIMIASFLTIGGLSALKLPSRSHDDLL